MNLSSMTHSRSCNKLSMPLIALPNETYRDCSTWSVVIRKTYGVRSLFKDLKSNLAQTIVAEKSEEQIRETIHVTPDGGLTQFTPEEAYLIAQSLPSLPPTH
jgi:predicted SPOUT superfamily RNA methylase MTH1